MTAVVVDASFAAALVIPSQRTDAARGVLAARGSQRYLAPYVFALELPWLLLKYERRLSRPGFAEGALAVLDEQEIELEDPPNLAARVQAFDLAVGRGIGFHDSMYLLLALSRGLPLVTRDGRVMPAARSLGLKIVDVR